MRGRFRAAWLGAGLAAGLLAGQSAQAGITIVIRPSGGVNFQPSTGGFCDVRGCPLGYWNMPVYYGPVLYQDVWYKGPVYYRTHEGAYEFWVAGDWHRNEWTGPPPDWAGKVEMGPPLGRAYYRQPNWSDWRYWLKKGWKNPR